MLIVQRGGFSDNFAPKGAVSPRKQQPGLGLECDTYTEDEIDSVLKKFHSNSGLSRVVIWQSTQEDEGDITPDVSSESLQPGNKETIERFRKSLSMTRIETKERKRTIEDLVTTS